MSSSRTQLRVSAALAMLFLAATAARAQDPGTDAAMQAAQMATQAAQQASQQAMQDAQMANQQAMQAAMNANDIASYTPCCGVPLTRAPRFSIKSGKYTSAISVRLTDATRGAIIYYTTDGWTPTAASARYLGPITIDATATLQAIAIAPNCSRSLVAQAIYTFPVAPSPAPASAELPVLPIGQGSLELRLDTPVQLLLSSPIDSHTAQIGDRISFALAENLKVGDIVVAPKGTPASGRVIQVDHPRIGGLPGEIGFRVESLDLHGVHIPLRGAEALEGKPEVTRSRVLTVIPGIGISALLVRGADAQIATGAALTATIPAGTVLAAPSS